NPYLHSTFQNEYGPPRKSFRAGIVTRIWNSYLRFPFSVFNCGGSKNVKLVSLAASCSGPSDNGNIEPSKDEALPSGRISSSVAVDIACFIPLRIRPISARAPYQCFSLSEFKVQTSCVTGSEYANNCSHRSC